MKTTNTKKIGRAGEARKGITTADQDKGVKFTTGYLLNMSGTALNREEAAGDPAETRGAESSGIRYRAGGYLVSISDPGAKRATNARASKMKGTRSDERKARSQADGKSAESSGIRYRAEGYLVNISGPGEKNEGAPNKGRNL